MEGKLGTVYLAEKSMELFRLFYGYNAPVMRIETAKRVVVNPLKGEGEAKRREKIAPLTIEEVGS